MNVIELFSGSGIIYPGRFQKEDTKPFLLI